MTKPRSVREELHAGWLRIFVGAIAFVSFFLMLFAIGMRAAEPGFVRAGQRSLGEIVRVRRHAVSVRGSNTSKLRAADRYELDVLLTLDRRGPISAKLPADPHQTCGPGDLIEIIYDPIRPESIAHLHRHNRAERMRHTIVISGVIFAAMLSTWVMQRYRSVLPQLSAT